jgi:hypothetical protein
MKTRKHRRRPDAQQREASFFAKVGKQADVDRRAQGGFFQPKLKIGERGDRLEQAADKAADTVVGHTGSGLDDVAIRRKEDVQRQTEKEKDVQARLDLQQKAEEEEESVQAQAEKEKEETSVRAQAEEEEQPVQTQDEKEEESVQTQAEKEGEESVRTQAENEREESVQAQAEEEEEVQAKSEQNLRLKGGEKEEEETVQAKSQSQIPHRRLSFAAKLKEQQGKGRPLPDEVRAEMESSLDADFSAVRIHTDEEAAQLSKMLKAQAFTRGDDIFFNQGKFDPETRAGKHLLAHELAHVKQQKGR